jgi:hypothetical protein
MVVAPLVRHCKQDSKVPTMATVKAIAITHNTAVDTGRHDLLTLVLSASLPLAVFVLANGVAELNGTLPLFFSPFGLPGWVGAALYIGSLPLFGIARWMIAREGHAGRVAARWIVALMAGAIVFPFIVAPLDSLMLSIASMALVIVGLAALARVAQISVKAALVMAPGLSWLGLSALVGLSFIAGWSPPFGLTNANNSL